MLIDLKDMIDRHHMRITGILHVGAHLGEEAWSYYENGVSNVVWIEGNPDLIPSLEMNVAPFGHRVIQALVADEDGKELAFNITNNGQSSSVLELGTHKIVSPDVFVIEQQTHSTVTLDSLALQTEHGFDGCNFLNMDLQGAELLALKGATAVLEQIEYIYTEINVDELYIGCARMYELDEYLKGFIRVETAMAGAAGWGDALYVRI